MKVMIATPTQNSTCTINYTASLINLFKEAAKYDDFELEFLYGTNEALVTHARNLCVNVFLKSDATHLLFIDSDIQFDGKQIIQMIRTKRDFVCGIYPKKKIDWEKVRVAALHGQPAHLLQSHSNEYLVVPSENTKTEEDGVIEIERAATGMMMLSKSVFETLKEKVNAFNLVSPIQSNVKFGQEEKYYEFFYSQIEPETNLFLNEDFSFCKLWIDNGGKIYGAPWIKLYHVGNHVFG